MPIAGRLPVHPFDKNESLETSSMTYYQSAVDPTHSVSLQDKIQNMDLPVCQCKVQTPDAGRERSKKLKRSQMPSAGSKFEWYLLLELSLPEG